MMTDNLRPDTEPVKREDLAERIDRLERRIASLPRETAEAVRQTPTSPLLDVRGLAAYLDVSERQVERLCASGEIAPLWIGGVRRFDRTTIDAYLRRAAKPRRKSRGAA